MAENLVKFVYAETATDEQIKNFDSNTIYFIGKGDNGGKLYKGSTLYDAGVSDALATLRTQIGTLPVGSPYVNLIDFITKKDDEAIKALDVAEFALAIDTNDVISIYGIKEVDGKIEKGDTPITFSKVAKTGVAADVTTTVITNGADEPVTLYSAGNVQGVLDAIAKKVNSIDSESKIGVEKQATPEAGYFATYVISQNGTQVGEKINIPRDYLVKAASVKTVTTANAPYTGAKVGDKYIDFEVNVKDGTADESHIYIPVNDLMKAITGGENAETDVTISDSNEITVAINKIAASKIAYSKGEAEETVQAALTRIDGDVTIDGSIEKKIRNISGDLDSLETTTKTNLVAAINEVRNSQTGVTAVETPGATEGNDGQIKITTRAADGTTTTTYATPKNLKSVATTGSAADVAFTAPSEGSSLTSENVQAAIAEVEANYKDAIANLDTNSDVTIASKSGNVVTIKGSVKEVDGIIQQGTATDITLDDVAVTGAAADVSFIPATNSDLVATDVNTAINELAADYQAALTWGSLS